GLNAANFAGHDDWRLPNVRELQSIANYENFNPSVSSEFTTACMPGATTVLTGSCTTAAQYWASSTSARAPTFAWAVIFSDGLAGRALERQSHLEVQHHGARRAAADGHLTVAGARARAVAVVGIVAGAEHGRVAHAARVLPGPAAGAHAARDVATPVDGDHVDRAEVILRLRRHLGILGGRAHQVHEPPVATAQRRRDLPIEGRPGARGEEPPARHVKLTGQTLGAGPGQEDVREAAHHLPRQRDDVDVAADGADRAGVERAPVHEAGVQLDLPQDVRQPAVSHAVIGGVGLHAADRRLDGVDGAPAVPEDAYPVGESHSGV